MIFEITKLKVHIFSQVCPQYYMVDNVINISSVSSTHIQDTNFFVSMSVDCLAPYGARP